MNNYSGLLKNSVHIFFQAKILFWSLHFRVIVNLILSF